jgi:hypothetical protein
MSNAKWRLELPNVQELVLLILPLEELKNPIRRLADATGDDSSNTAGYIIISLVQRQHNRDGKT